MSSHLSPREEDGFHLYFYEPSMAAAAVFCALFAIASIAHTWQLFRNRTWYFIPFLLGCYCEVVGFIGRILSINEGPNYTLNPYIIQAVLILVAPALFAASIYMILGRLIRMIHAEHLSLIRTTWLTKIFVTADVLAFLMQGAGGAMLSQPEDPDLVKLGQNVILAGLFVQLVAFSVFILVCGLFHYRVVRRPTEESAANGRSPWLRYLVVLYVASALILVRSVFRAAEYIMGRGGELERREYYQYIFDLSLMLVVVVLFNVWHPSEVVSRDAARKPRGGGGGGGGRGPKEMLPSTTGSEVELQMQRERVAEGRRDWQDADADAMGRAV